MIFIEHYIFPHTHIPVNLSCLSWAGKEKDRRQKSRSPSGDVLPCRHCNLLYKLHVSSAARLKTSSSVYQSPVNCWVNFPLTLVLWFITLLKIWHCQSKCSGQAFSHCPVLLPLMWARAQSTQKKRRGLLPSRLAFIFWFYVFLHSCIHLHSVCLNCWNMSKKCS